MPPSYPPSYPPVYPPHVPPSELKTCLLGCLGNMLQMQDHLSISSNYHACLSQVHLLPQASLIRPHQVCVRFGIFECNTSSTNASWYTSWWVISLIPATYNRIVATHYYRYTLSSKPASSISYATRCDRQSTGIMNKTIHKFSEEMNEVNAGTLKQWSSPLEILWVVFKQGLESKVR